MNTKLILSGTVAVIALLAFAACGGDSDDGGDTGAIRIQKGLAVAAIGNGLAGGDGGGTGAEPAPAAQNGPFGPISSETSSTSARDAISYGGGFAPEQYPFQQAGTNGVTVQGYASASADADSAIVEFYFYAGGDIGIKPLPYDVAPGFEGGSSPAAPDLQPAEPITEATLQPVIDAIVAAGVSADDVEFINAYADPYSSSATIRATVKNVDSVDAVVQAANSAAAGIPNIAPSSTNVSYTVSDCAALELAATKAAVEDAGERATSFSQALGIGLGSVIGASNYSYYGGTPCDAGFFKGPYPIGGVGYYEGQPREVQVYANIAVTYAIQ